MANYDRFPLQGGLDTATPYIARQPGTLLTCRNFAPDTDGGYRLMNGYERFDGRPAPSEVVVTSLHMLEDVTGVLPGETVTGSLSGAKGVVGTTTGKELWVDVQPGDNFVNGDVVSGFTVSYITTEPVGFSSYDRNAQRAIVVVAPQNAGFMPSVGSPIRGNLSGAVAEVIHVKETVDNWWIYTVSDEGALQVGETIQTTDGGTSTADRLIDVEPMLSTPDTPAGVWFYLSELRRNVIGMVPGSGPVTGVWQLSGQTYAFRDGNLKGEMFKATPNGWVPLDLGFTITWDNRATTVKDNMLAAGDIIKGGTSGALATVGYVGYTSQDHSAGYISYKSVTGTFTVGEDILNTSQDDLVVGKIAADQTANVLPKGGVYRFVNHNFFGLGGEYTMFGVNGIGAAFAYNDIDGFASIITGTAVENPFDVIEHKDHLFLAYPKGSLQHSGTGSPFSWNGGLGAGEIIVGSEIRGLVSSPKSLVICTEKDVQALSGDDVESWVRDIITSHSGVALFSAKYQSQTFVLSRSGITAVERTDQFGNFNDSTLSETIRNSIRPNYEKCLGSLVRKDAGHYVVHYDGGNDIGMATNQSQVIGFFNCDHGGISVRSSVNPYGTVFFTSDTGFVYQDYAGYSNDGEERVAVLRTSFANQGDPDTRKRYRRIDMTFSSDTYVNALLNFAYDKGGDPAQFSLDSGLISARGGRWDLANWNEVFWDASEFPTIASDIDGLGFDISVMIYVSSRIQSPFVAEDVSLEWTPRRKVR